MAFLATYFLLITAVYASNAEKTVDAIAYIDEVISIYIPWAITENDLEVAKLPDFTHNFQNRSSDGSAVTGKIYYHSGNLTGLDKVSRKSCESPTWSSGNISLSCNIVLQGVDVKYQGRAQLLTSLRNGVQIQMHDIVVEGSQRNIEAILEITSSPKTRSPYVKNLKIVNQGTSGFSFHPIRNLSEDLVRTHFIFKFNEVFYDLFYGIYRKALGRAAASIPFP